MLALGALLHIAVLGKITQWVEWDRWVRGMPYVKPVDRFTPARKAETGR